MSSTPRTESTGPASSATDTTQTPAGVTTATAKKRAPSAEAFARERRRRKKAEARLKHFEKLASDRAKEAAKYRQMAADAEAKAKATQGILDWLARCHVETSKWDRCVEIHTCVRVRHDLIPQAGAASAVYLLTEIAKSLRLHIANTDIAGLLKSPITLQDNEDAASILSRAKYKWLEGVMCADPGAFPAWKTLNNPHRDLCALWDDAFRAIKDLASSIPPYTKIVRVTTSPPKA